MGSDSGHRPNAKSGLEILFGDLLAGASHVNGTSGCIGHGDGRPMVAAAPVGADANDDMDCVVKCSLPPSARLAADRARSPAKSDVETDEGQALADALSAAQAALDFARQFVTSPSLDHLAVLKSHSAHEPDTIQEPSSFAVVAPHGSAVTVPSISMGGCCHRLHNTRSEHEDGIHACFGNNEARMQSVQHRTRVRRQHSQPCSSRERPERVENQRLVQQRVRRDAEEAAKSEPLRRRAALRVASEVRAQQEEQRQQAEEEASEFARRAADAEVCHRRRVCAARRAKSEQQRRKSLATDMLADLIAKQRQRLQEDEHKGDVLRGRCEASDWSSCGPLVNKLATRVPCFLPKVLPAASRCEGLGVCKASQQLSTSHLPPLVPVR